MRKRLRNLVESAVDIFSAANVEVAGSDPEASQVWCIEGFRSAILPNERDLWVYLPPRYACDSHDRYPVLYLQDGQNLFVDEASSSGRSWRVQSTADGAIGSREAAPMIIVGIQTSDSRRTREYTPTPDRKHPHGGGADSYVHFLVGEVKPRIARSSAPDRTAEARQSEARRSAGFSRSGRPFSGPAYFRRLRRCRLRSGGTTG